MHSKVSLVGLLRLCRRALPSSEAKARGYKSHALLNLPALILLTCACSLTASGQGTIYFQNRGGSYNGQLDERVLSYDSTPVAGDRFSAELWVGRTVESLEPVVSSQTVFRSRAPGYVVSIIAVVVPDIEPGETAWVQVRAWENSPTITNWDDAWLRGESNIFPLVLGGGPDFPPPIIYGMRSFTLFPVPEPSTATLALLGMTGWLLLAGWRKGAPSNAA
jgi:hypothetical protein